MEQLVSCSQQLWRTVLQATTQAELQSLSEDLDSQSKTTESWIRERLQKLQCMDDPPEERLHTAQVC